MAIPFPSPIVTSQTASEEMKIELTGSQRKTAHAVRVNVESLCREFGIDRVGFLTLTVGDTVDGEFVQVWDHSEASRRFNNLNRHVLPDLFAKAVVVTERHKSGAIHFHLVGALRAPLDIRTGFEHDAVSRGDYRSASDALRALWASLRDVLPRYGFGRAELTPIRKGTEEIASYVSKYISKNLEARTEDDARKKLVRYIGFKKRQLRPNDFSWATPGAAAWRRSVARVASLAGVVRREDVSAAFGPRWAWRLTRVVNNVGGHSGVDFVMQNFGARQRVLACLEKSLSRRWTRENEARVAARPQEWRPRGWRQLTVRRQRVFSLTV